jgi:hypothetical protein
MTIPFPSRSTLLVIGVVVLVAAVLFGLSYLSPERGVRRAWGQLATAIEKNDRDALGRLLGDDYKDGFGQDRAAALETFALVRRQFIACSVSYAQTELILDTSEQSATTRSLVRLSGSGGPGAQATIEASKYNQQPVSFRWRRDGKPWEWRLVSIEHPEAARALARLQREAASLGL